MNQWVRVVLLAGVLGLSVVQPVCAAGPIVLDGQFGDWDGQTHITDPQGDANNTATDLAAFYFANNPNVGMAYFMAERWEATSNSLNLVLQIDTNNNGSYSDAQDRIVSIYFRPMPGGGSNVDVTMTNGTGAQNWTIASGADWGDGKTGRRVEWGISFSDLGIQPNQTIRMTLVSMQGNNISDGCAEVQWSPASALGIPLLAVVLVAGIGLLLYRRRKLT